MIASVGCCIVGLSIFSQTTKPGCLKIAAFMDFLLLATNIYYNSYGKGLTHANIFRGAARLVLLFG